MAARRTLGFAIMPIWIAAAMVAGLAGAGQGIWGDEALALDVEPNLSIVS